MKTNSGANLTLLGFIGGVLLFCATIMTLCGLVIFLYEVLR